MKLPAGKTLSPDAVAKIRDAVFRIGSAVLSTPDLAFTPETLLQVTRVVERAVEKELTTLSLTDIPNYIALPVDPNAPKVGRPKGKTK